MQVQNFWRRVLRLRLATLMLLVTLCCMALAFRQAFLMPYAAQDVAVKRLIDTGATFAFETPQPAWLRPLIGEKRYRKLVMLNLDGHKVRDERLHVLRDLPFVRELYLANNPLTDRGLQDIGRLRQVRRLTLQNTRVTDALMPQLSLLKKLEYLDIHATRIGDEGLSALAGHPQLREIVLGPRITAAGLKHLTEMPSLERVDLRHTWLSLDDVSHLAGANVRQLDLSESQLPLRGASLAVFKDLRNLRSLPADVIDCTETDLVQLSQLHQLKTLNIQGRDLSDRAIPIIAALPAIEKCIIEGNITTGSIDLLENSYLKHCEIVTPQVTSENADQLRRYKGQTRIRFHTPWLTPREAAVLNRQLPANILVNSLARNVRRNTSEEVRELMLSDGTAVINDWRPLLRWRRIASIQLTLLGGTSVPVEFLEQLKDLERYRIRVRALDADQAQRLTRLPKLEYGALVVEDVVPPEVRIAINQSNEANRTLPAGERRTIVFAEHFSFLQNPAGHEFAFVLGMDRNVRPAALRLANPQTRQLEHFLAQQTFEAADLHAVRPNLNLSKLKESPSIHALALVNSLLTRAQWQQVWQLDRITDLSIRNCRLTDKDLDGIQQLQNLQRLTLENVQISDEAMTRLAQLPQLRSVELGSQAPSFAGPFFSDQGLAVLGQITSLESLTIRNLPITGSGFEKWSRGHQLSMLILTDTDITDRGAAKLAGLANLQLLSLGASQVTEALLESLEKDNSKLSVIRSYPRTYPSTYPILDRSNSRLFENQ